MTDSFHLPKISLEGLEKIIIAYSHVPDNPTLDILARLTKMGSAAISRNNKFLMDIGIIAGAADKTVTPLGQKLGHALEYAMGADAQAYWREAVASNAALMALMATEHLQRGMSEKDLSAHILDVSVHKKHAHTQTGARCLIDILLESGLLVQDKDKLAAAPAKSPDQPEPAGPRSWANLRPAGRRFRAGYQGHHTTGRPYRGANCRAEYNTPGYACYHVESDIAGNRRSHGL